MRTRSALPSLLTISNLFCGFMSIFYAMNGKLVSAAWLIVIAGLLDAFDGKIARFFEIPSNFGVQFDSVVDVCSFGVAPAVLMLFYYEDLLDNRWLPFFVCFLFLMCGALRLARFNLTAEGLDKLNFTGLPIPTAAGTLAAYIIFSLNAWNSNHEPHVAIGLSVMLSFLMVSSFEYESFPKFTFETKRDRVKLAIALSVVFLVVFFTDELFFPLALGFSLSGAVRWLFIQITGRETVKVRN